MEEMSMQETEGSQFEDDALHHQEEEAHDLFWKVLQNELNTEIPTYVKNVMRLSHLNKPLSFRCIRDDTISELETFARKNMIYQLMGVQVNLEDYYGPFYKMPHKFRFAIGDRFLIKQLVSCAKSKSDDFWKRMLSPNIIAATTTTTTTSVQYVTQPQDAASSELELSDEEDKQQQQQEEEEPFDLDRERRMLAEMVRSTLLKEDYGQAVDPKQLASRVTLKTTDERDIVTGFIKCVFCSTRLMIRKQTFGARKPRWVISNYRRHIRFHLDGKLKKPSAQDFVEQQQQQQPCHNTEFVVVNTNQPVDEEKDQHDHHQHEQTEDASHW